LPRPRLSGGSLLSPRSDPSPFTAREEAGKHHSKAPDLAIDLGTDYRATLPTNQGDIGGWFVITPEGWRS
jgi:hypothetical protein